MLVESGHTAVMIHKLDCYTQNKYQNWKYPMKKTEMYQTSVRGEGGYPPLVKYQIISGLLIWRLPLAHTIQTKQLFKSWKEFKSSFPLICFCEKLIIVKIIRVWLWVKLMLGLSAYFLASIVYVYQQFCNLLFPNCIN